MKPAKMHPADQVISIMKNVYRRGLTTTSGGNISVIDENGNIWITPSGVDKGTLATEDMVSIKKDGTVTGRHKPSIELPFHKTIYETRPDIKAVIHAHSPSLTTYSMIGKIPGTYLPDNFSQMTGNIGFVPYISPGSEKLGIDIGVQYKKGLNTVILDNHGVICAASDIYKAYAMLEELDYIARLEVIICNMHNAGYNVLNKSIDFNLFINSTEMFEGCTTSETNHKYYEQRKILCDMVKRAYYHNLALGFDSTFSLRLGDDLFIATPEDMDINFLEEEDILIISGGYIANGKRPGAGAWLHRQIYLRNNDIKSIITARPVNITAFALTGRKLETKAIAESYFALGDISVLPADLNEICNYNFTYKTPAVIIDNGFFIAAGRNASAAYDRLEVAEYTAQSLAQADYVGSVNVISNKEIEKLLIIMKL